MRGRRRAGGADHSGLFARRPRTLALIALAVACGSPAPSRQAATLPAAGTTKDDGRGVIARLSAGRAPDPASRARRPQKPADDRSDAESGEEPGPRVGSRYENYRFDRSARPHVAPRPYAGRYAPNAPVAFGSIEGTVVWPHAPRAPESLTSGTHACGSTANQTLALGAGGTVAGAVVYLEDIPSGRLTLGRNTSSSPTKNLQTGGVLEWRDCRFHPHVQVSAPIGSVLALSTADRAIRVTATRVEGRARQALWSVALGAPGAAHEHLLDRSGFLELRAEPTGPLPGAWVVVAPHPYFAITDERGRFVLPEIPPGTYTLVVWHEPVLVGVTRTGEPITQAPAPVRRKVAVDVRRAVHLTVELPPAH